MRLVWTKGRSPLSWVIRKITGDDCSHFAFVFESHGRSGLMFESNLLGTHPAFLKTSLKAHTIIHDIVVPMSQVEEDKVWDLVVEKYDGRPYDFCGALFLGVHKFMQRFFGKKLPEKNRWARGGSFFCDEIYDVFNHVDGFPKIDVTNGMDTPHDVWEKLKNWEYAF